MTQNIYIASIYLFISSDSGQLRKQQKFQGYNMISIQLDKSKTQVKDIVKNQHNNTV